MISPVTHSNAYSNEENTWTSFYVALKYMEQNKMDGLAFVLKSGITFIDLDHVCNPSTGEIENITARNILDILPPTYTEISASNTGIHIMCLGKLPPNARNRNNRFGVNIEMYDNRRFVCFTGNVWENRTALLDCTAEIAQISNDYVGTHLTKQTSFLSFDTITSNDSKLIDKILNSKQAKKFSELYSGNISNYESHSQADSAFVWLLAFWTHDRNQIDRIFRTSGLFRTKWDRRLYNTTYGDDMINTALSNVRCHRQLQRF